MKQIFKIKGVEFATEIRGKGFPLVFVHGFGEDRTVWSDFAIPFEKEHQIIDLDLPGFGDSQYWDKFSIPGAADLLMELLNEFDLDKFILVGHSMGGYIALEFAGKYSQYLSGLVMFHSHPYSDTSEKKKGRQKAIEFIEKNGSALFAKQLVPGMFSPGFAEKQPKLLKKMVNKAASYKPESYIIALEAMKKRNDRSEILEKLACPCLFIIGEEDGLIPAEYSLKQTALPSVGSIHILENVAHLGMLEAEQKCQNILQDFVHFCLGFVKKK